MRAVKLLFEFLSVVALLVVFAFLRDGKGTVTYAMLLWFVLEWINILLNAKIYSKQDRDERSRDNDKKNGTDN